MKQKPQLIAYFVKLNNLKMFYFMSCFLINFEVNQYSGNEAFDVCECFLSNENKPVLRCLISIVTVLSSLLNTKYGTYKVLRQ